MASGWSYGVNSHIKDELPDEAKAFKGSGSFRADFAALAKQCRVVAHTAFLPARPAAAAADAVEAEDAQLSAQSIMLDRPTVQVLRHAMSATTSLKVLRLSSCRLDAEMLRLLRLGLSETCTVARLQLDWNPLQVPHENPSEARRIAAEGSTEERAAVAKRQHERRLREIAESTEARASAAAVAPSTSGEAVVNVELGAALLAAAEAEDPGAPGKVLDKQRDRSVWSELCNRMLRMPLEEAEELFEILNSTGFGKADGRVPLRRFEKAAAAAREAAAGVDESTDQVAAAFTCVIDATSPLEVVSFRCCNIARIEAQAFGRALAAPSPHLKALNLWGNYICDRGAEALGKAFEANFGLQFLGLGKNLVTHIGLQHLCRALGVRRLTEKAEADPIMKQLKDLTKDRDKKMKGFVPKVDGSGRERYNPGIYIPTCEEFKDAAGKPYWLHVRNVALKTMVLDHNPIMDAQAVWNLQPYGCGELVLRDTPCVEALKHLCGGGYASERQSSPDGSEAPEGSSASPEAAASRSPFLGAAAAITGWRLVLQ
eukprot:CAMPEP_0177210184 /NCGR_PEP_ID=MMETSP0367-20130122/31418_1 /TAXON_ID=447022 ORGANISM="Scrippsiella hangoei-like, Strain SHHI-4" /NCGR_SAMPLE_ID=MMETSP0367 /ASSEMBLY_ACC=CAM_ASM_000362 /LENGTH=542 /DNA_ID=CAMNT_0018659275 /DNA_START=21 /DNA_END=1649 /DNA_ORIENTATION=-